MITVRGEQQREEQRISDNLKHEKKVDEIYFDIREVNKKIELLSKRIDDNLELYQLVRLYHIIEIDKKQDPNNPNNLMKSVQENPTIPTPN